MIVVGLHVLVLPPLLDQLQNRLRDQQLRHLVRHTALLVEPTRRAHDVRDFAFARVQESGTQGFRLGEEHFDLKRGKKFRTSEAADQQYVKQSLFELCGQVSN